MKRRGPSNIITVAPWMRNLVTKPPEGTHTPDQVAMSLALVIELHDRDVKAIREAIYRIALLAPYAHQKFIHKLDHKDDQQMMKQVEAFIQLTNEKLEEKMKHQNKQSSEPMYSEDEWGTKEKSKSRSRDKRDRRTTKRQQPE